MALGITRNNDGQYRLVLYNCTVLRQNSNETAHTLYLSSGLIQTTSLMI